MSLASPGLETLSGSTQLRFRAALQGRVEGHTEAGLLPLGKAKSDGLVLSWWVTDSPDDTVTTIHTLGVQVQPKLPTLQVVSTTKNGLAASGPVFTTIQQSGIVNFAFTIRNTGAAPTAALEPSASEFDSDLGFSVMFLTTSYPALAPGSSTIVQVSGKWSAVLSLSFSFCSESRGGHILSRCWVGCFRSNS